MKKEKVEILRRITRLLEQEGLITKEELIRIMTILEHQGRELYGTAARGHL